MSGKRAAPRPGVFESGTVLAVLGVGMLVVALAGAVLLVMPIRSDQHAPTSAGASEPSGVGTPAPGATPTVTGPQRTISDADRPSSGPSRPVKEPLRTARRSVQPDDSTVEPVASAGAVDLARLDTHPGRALGHDKPKPDRD